MTDTQTPLSGTYDASYVALSLCIAVAAAYVALTLGERVTENRGQARYWWQGGGAVVMGSGVWAMHFTGMLAFHLPVTVMYDLPSVGLSLVAAIAASGVALLIVSRPTMSRARWLVGGTLMGSGIAAMHYLGMAAMRMRATPRWDFGVVAISLVVAIAVSLVALRFAFNLRSVAHRRFAWRRLGAAAIMGVAIAGMHYTGMAAATFEFAARLQPHGYIIDSGSITALIILIATIIMLAFVVVVSLLQQHLSSEQSLMAQQQRYFRTVLANAPVILIGLDARGHVAIAEGRDLARLGHPAQAMIGQSFMQLYAHVPALVEQAARALAGEAGAADATVAGIVLDTRWTPLRDENGAVTSVVMVATDISARRSAELALTYRSLHDPLTNLPNRIALNERLAALFAAASEPGHSPPFGLAFIDLDRFKEVNDTLGHDVGDALLKSVGARIDGYLRSLGIVGGAMRLGGDEFALLLPDISERRATELVCGLLRDCSAPHVVGDYTLDVHPSLGLALAPQHAADAQALLRCADVAMYFAKRRGLGYAVYDPSHDRHTKALVALESDMRQAITDGGFELQYQPQVDVVSGRIAAVEALIRWEHPTRGRLMPDEFIPLAENTGLIVPLTHWVLEEALRQVSEWAADGFALSVAVNISMRGLREATLPDTIARLLQRYAVAPERLVIEVTESVIMADDEQTREVFTQLAALGVVLSIDDFGTGYSSLSYLRQLPVAELKIDKSFVLPLGKNDTKAGELVRLILNLGHNLGLRVVAEGVETEEVFDFLAGLGCDIAQGYFLSRPLAASKLRALLSTSWRQPTPAAEIP